MLVATRWSHHAGKRHVGSWVVAAYPFALIDTRTS